MWRKLEQWGERWRMFWWKPPKMGWSSHTCLKRSFSRKHLQVHFQRHLESNECVLGHELPYVCETCGKGIFIWHGYHVYSYIYIYTWLPYIYDMDNIYTHIYTYICTYTSGYRISLFQVWPAPTPQAGSISATTRVTLRAGNARWADNWLFSLPSKSPLFSHSGCGRSQ